MVNTWIYFAWTSLITNPKSTTNICLLYRKYRNEKRNWFVHQIQCAQSDLHEQCTCHAVSMRFPFFLSLLTFPDVYCVGFVLLAPAPNDDVMLKAFFQGKAKRYVSHLKAHPYVNHIRDKAHFTVDKFIISTIYPFSYYYLMCIPWIMTLEVFLRFLFFIYLTRIHWKIYEKFDKFDFFSSLLSFHVIIKYTCTTFYILLKTAAEFHTWARGHFPL